MFSWKGLAPTLLASSLFASSPLPARAGTPAPSGDITPVEAVETVSAYDRIWSHATLYQNDDNPVIQKLAFTGRAQADAAFFDSNQRDYERFHWRRLRMGFKTTLFDDFTFHVEAEFDANDLDFDDAHELFLGLNWCLYGHNIKWPNELEYTTASDDGNEGYNGWGLTSGIRLT